MSAAANSSPEAWSSSLMAPRSPLLVTLTRTARSHFSTSQLSARWPWCDAEGGMLYTYWKTWGNGRTGHSGIERL